MATRNDVQIALDLVKFINIANDLIDVTSDTLRDIDSETGVQLIKMDGSGPRDYTFGELKERATKQLQAILNYENRVIAFIQSFGLQNAVAALQSLNLSGADMRDEMVAIADEARYVLGQIGPTTQKSELIPLADHIDVAIPKLDLVRRTWRYIS